MAWIPDKTTHFNTYQELKIMNIESLFTAVFFGYYLNSLQVNWTLALLGGVSVVVGLKMIFRFKLGYIIISILFSAFWSICFSSGWFRDGNWVMGTIFAIVVFFASIAGHKVNYEENE